MSAIRKGDKIIVVEGPMQGMEGIVVREPSRQFDLLGGKTRKMIGFDCGGTIVSERVSWVRVISAAGRKS